MEFGCCDMVEEHLKHCITFDLAETLDTGRKVLVYEQRLSLRHRMGAHDWMQRLRKRVFPVPTKYPKRFEHYPPCPDV